MSTRLVVIASMFMPVLATGAAEAAPVVLPSSGNIYELIVDDQISYTSARAAATAAGGHLVTITSPEEQAFVETLLVGTDAPTGSYWIGLEQHLGQFGWSTGETSNYMNFAPMEPNDFVDKEVVGQIYWAQDDADDLASRRGTWNDAPIDGYPNLDNPTFPTMDLTRGGYIIETEGLGGPPVAVPLPAAVFAAPLTAVLVGWAMRRRRPAI